MTADHLPEATPPYTQGAEKLLAAASDLFYREGIHAVGVDTVAAAAGVTKKTLYDRFGSKDSLVVAYLRGRDARWRDGLERELEEEPAGSLDRILAIFDISQRWSIGNGSRGCSAINARAETGDPDNPIAVEAVRQKKWLRSVLEQLCEEAGLVDAAAVANSLFLLYEGALVTTGMGTFAEPFNTARETARMILDAAQVR